ncbi:N-acetylglucosamine kinase [Paenibacillus sp. NPDC057967]|uniref:N-acetylglucosamine kinase n=1 Tax=Paenibacillus sp. NPDC057967 TaxID=3346293 RepID=UPI0036DBEAC2
MQLNKEKRIFIGMDGGGSKTACAACNEQGHILAYAIGESSNVKSRPRAQVEQTLLELIYLVIRQSGAELKDIVSVTLGLAGGHRIADKEKMIHFLQPNLFEHTSVNVYNDAETALSAGTWGRAGMVLIAGTGSIVHAVIPERKLNIRLGGWGYLLGDEGGGFDIGRQALLAVTRSVDGVGEPTALTPAILEFFSIHEPIQLIDFIYEQSNARKVIANLATLVLQEAEQGDSVAISIINEAIASLGKLIVSAQKKLDEANVWQHDQSLLLSPMRLVLVGGLFKNKYFISKFNSHLAAHNVNLESILLRTPPVLGACIMGLLDHGIEINDEIRKNAIESWIDG